MSIFLVDVQLSSIKEDSLSCIPFFLSLQPRSRTQKSSILENLSTQSLAWVRLGPYSVFLMSVRRIKVILQPQLVDDAIAGNSSMACTDVSDFTFKTACYFKA